MAKKIEKSKKDSIATELENKLVRALADYDNLRKRIEREKEGFFHLATKGLIGKFLSIYDMLVSAQDHLNDTGVAIIIDELKKVLADEGVEQIKVGMGDNFNGDFMEAIETIDGGKNEEGKVAKVLLTGWMFREGPVIRPAKVKVFNYKD